MLIDDDGGDELAAILTAMRAASMNVIGFHHLAEDFPNTPLKRTLYEAQAYASGHELALLVARLGLHLRDRS